eukprot:g13959.t1
MQSIEKSLGLWTTFSVKEEFLTASTLMQSESKMAAALDSSSTGALEFHDVDEGMEHALRRIFYDLDANNNNVVEKRELLRALRDGLPSLYRAVESFPRLKPILRPSSYDQTFLLMSTQREGVVTYDEFKSFCVKISRQGGDRQFQAGDAVEMTDSQMRRIVILSALQRIVDLRNRKINSNVEPVLSAAQEKFAQMNVTMTNFQNSKSPGGRYLNENAIPNMEEVTLALGEMLAVCRATTPPSQQNLSTSVNAMMETQEDTAWKGASIADLDSSYTNAKKGGNVVPEPAEVVDRERPQTPPDPDIVVLAKMLKRIHGAKAMESKMKALQQSMEIEQKKMLDQKEKQRRAFELQQKQMAEDLAMRENALLKAAQNEAERKKLEEEDKKLRAKIKASKLEYERQKKAIEEKQKQMEEKL